MASIERFGEFWRLYPRKLGRYRAQQLFLRIPDRLVDEVILGLEAWIVYWEQMGTETEFKPYGSTWLYQRRWEEIPELPDGKQSKTEQQQRRTKSAIQSVLGRKSGTVERTVPCGIDDLGNRGMAIGFGRTQPGLLFPNRDGANQERTVHAKASDVQAGVQQDGGRRKE